MGEVGCRLAHRCAIEVQVVRCSKKRTETQAGRRGIMRQIWLPCLKSPIGLVLSSLKEGLTFGVFFSGVEFEECSSRGGATA